MTEASSEPRAAAGSTVSSQGFQPVDWGPARPLEGGVLTSPAGPRGPCLCPSCRRPLSSSSRRPAPCAACPAPCATCPPA
eukprot:7097625-Lingulodinium_polyedra.AAC.1